MRTSIGHFSLSNPTYIGATVTFYTVDVNGAKTSTLATLYGATAGTATLANPQTLDSQGKFVQPVYVDAAVIMTVSGALLADHDTGIVAPPWNFRGTWATGTDFSVNDVVVDGPSGNDTGNLYVSNERHTSGTFSTDLNTNGYWTVFVDAMVAFGWATKTDGAVSGGEFSAKAYAIGGDGVTDTASKGSAKEWATNAEDITVDGSEFSAKHYSIKAQAQAQAATAAAGSHLFTSIVTKATADSPYTLVSDTDDGTLYVLDDDGVIDMDLPSIAAAGEGERYGFMRTGTSYAITLSRNGSDTINGVAGDYTMNLVAGEILLLVADDATPNNWVVIPWTQAVAGNGLTKSNSTISLKPIVVAAIALGDETTAITTGTDIVTFHAPVAFTLTGVVAGLTVAQASGNILTFDVNEAGGSILSTKLTIDNTELVSTTATTPAVVSDTAIAAGAKITVDVDQIGNGSAKGAKIYLVGYPT